MRHLVHVVTNTGIKLNEIKVPDQLLHFLHHFAQPW